MRQRFDPWQDIFKIFTISMYKCYFEKPNIDFQKKHLSTKSRLSIFHIQISNVHMGVAPGPASQDAVLKLKYASPGLQCGTHMPTELARIAILPFYSIQNPHYQTVLMTPISVH